MRRRHIASGLAALWPLAGLAQDDDSVRPGRRLRFPADHGAHPGSRTEWWYLTGWLQPSGAPVAGASVLPRWGFQITFFRSRTGLAASLPGRLAPRQLLFAHAALTDLGDLGDLGTESRPATHRHDQRLARWNGSSDAPLAHARRDDAALALLGWRLWRDDPDGWQARLSCDGFEFELGLQAGQPLLLQGVDGYSRKGPDPAHASHYYSQPQLLVRGRLRQGAGDRQTVQGRAWLDHEWSDSLLAPEAQGWDWLGINLFDGSALTAFRLRPRQGATPVWAGGSFRDAGGAQRDFQPGDVVFEPGRTWLSPATGARYPVSWRLRTPVGAFDLVALLDSQELDSRGNTGSVYWEGLAELRDAQGRRVGLGYLEMTGYADRPAV